MDFELNLEDRLIRDAIRNWVQKECTPEIVSVLDDKNEFPRKLIQDLAKLGFSGLTIPAEYKGAGRNYLGACIVCEEIAAIYPVLATCYASSAFWGGAVISELGTNRQKEKYLPTLAERQSMVALAIFEYDDCVENPIETKAIMQGNAYLLNGRKSYVMLADQADLILFLANNPRSDSNKQMTLFCVDKDTKGVEILPVEKMGYNGASFCEIRLNDVEVPADSILGGEENSGLIEEQLVVIQDIVRLSIASQAIGLSRGAFDIALQHAKKRVQFEQPIGRFPAIRDKLINTSCGIESARMLVYKAACLADKGDKFSKEVATGKYLAAETAVKTAIEGLQILGGYGYTMESAIQRYVRDSIALLSMGQHIDSLKEQMGAYLGLY